MVTIEETLKSGDLPADLKPHLVYGEVMEGARKPLEFLQAVREDSSLIGAKGTKISVPVASQLSASTITESNLDSSGYTATDKTMTDSDVSIGNEVYCAVKLSDILGEDQPDIDWVRLNLKNMGLAVAEKLDADIRDALIAGAGGTTSATTAGTLAYDDVVNAQTAMKQAHWFPERGNPPILFMPPACEGDVVKDTRFYDTARYASADVGQLQGEAGKFASCRAVVTSGFATPAPTGAPEVALVVMPPNHKFGPSTILAWKRKMTVKSEREEIYARTFYVTSTRYGIAVVNSGAVRLISNC
jgi:N4-gp56 family major capsid protein